MSYYLPKKYFAQIHLQIYFTTNLCVSKYHLLTKKRAKNPSVLLIFHKITEGYIFLGKALAFRFVGFSK